jgi:predicted MFS family arabinose efflux permease
MRTVLILSLVGFFSLMDRQVLTILVDPVKQDLKLNDSSIGALTGLAFVACYVFAGVPLARMADRGSRRLMIAGTLAAWSIATGLCGLAQTFLQLAAARAMVAICEAGAQVSIYSIISQLFPADRRAMPIAVLGAGGSLGIMVALAGGGWMSEAYGWRAVFFVLGLPGLLVAAIVAACLREPPRTATPKAQVDLWRAIHHLFSRPSYVLCVFAGAATTLTAHATMAWAPSLLMRVHGMPAAQVGSLLGMALGPSLIVGGLASGHLADRLAARDLRWCLWAAASASGAAFPLGLALAFAPSPTIVLILLFPYMVLLTATYTPIVAMTQASAPPHMRALAAAMMMFVISLGGSGLGPWVVGLLNDAFAATAGNEGVRYSLSIAGLGGIACGVLCLFAARFIRADRMLAETS